MKKVIKKKIIKKVYEYDSNNSGGTWWLKDKDWQALEDKGWTVQWGGLWFCTSGFNSHITPEPLPKKCKSKKGCSGHASCKSLKEVKERKAEFLGASATHATKKFLSLEDAIDDFERITGQSVSDQGCPCCGAPHYISEKN